MRNRPRLMMSLMSAPIAHSHFRRPLGREPEHDVHDGDNHQRILVNYRVARKLGKTKDIGHNDQKGQQVEPKCFAQEDTFRIHVYLRKNKKPAQREQVRLHEAAHDRAGHLVGVQLNVFVYNRHQTVCREREQSSVSLFE